MLRRSGKSEKPIDADALLDWLDTFHGRSSKEAKNHPDKDIRMYLEGRSDLAETLSSMIRSGYFDPLNRKIPEFEVGDMVYHIKRDFNDLEIIGLSKSKMTASVIYKHSKFINGQMQYYFPVKSLRHKMDNNNEKIKSRDYL
ncbi:hypothetical protein ACTHPH_21935 [Paenibacillus pasadenensis]|uniref:hypothetical protein n=1 Tax=Paenibacillus pasadenensis TaxID=217090 RepID=UPI0003FD8BC6|nr:hypothetical protein [Paenibacillus pasadenensis]